MFQKLGFELQRLGPETLAIRQIPALLKQAEANRLVADVLADLMEYGTSVNSPEMNAGALPQDKIRINVSLLADGTVECDGRILPRDVLLQQLAARRAELENDNFVVLLRGDADQSIGALVALWRDLKRIGLTKITLVTQAERAAR